MIRYLLKKFYRLTWWLRYGNVPYVHRNGCKVYRSYEDYCED